MVKTKTLSDEAADAIRRSTIDVNQLRLPPNMDRKLYQEVNAVLESIGGKWKPGKVKAHVFPADVPIKQKLTAIVDAGAVVLPSKNGYFPTPDWLVEYMLGLADIEPEHKVLEPSAGQGAIADRIREITGRVVVCEILPENSEVLAGKGYSVEGDIFECSFPGPCFDRIVMNPPFEQQADIDHVLHVWQWLKPGGRLVSVMSAGVTFREDKKARAFRAFLAEHDALVETNPDGAFKESGTGVSTVIVTIAKPAEDLAVQMDAIGAEVTAVVAVLNEIEAENSEEGDVVSSETVEAPVAVPMAMDLGLRETEASAASVDDQVALVVLVPIDAITPSSDNPRKLFDEDEIAGLAASIKTHGLMQPLTVRRTDNGYELIAGERRLRALQLLGRQSAPVIVQPGVSPRQALELALVENVQRVQLNAVEEARSITTMLTVLNMTPTEIAASLGKKLSYVERALATMRLPDEVLAELDTGRLSPAQAGALARWAEYPKLAQLMAYHAIMGKVAASTIDESPLPFADQLYGDGLVTEVSHKPFRDAACVLCPYAALVTERRDGSRDRYWCLRPTHAAELDVEFEHQKARDQESARVMAREAHLEADPTEKQAKAPDLSRLPYNTYETVGYRTMPPTCTGECPCRGVCQGSGGQLVEICLDTGRLRALKAGATRSKNKTAKTDKEGLLTDALIELDRLGGDGGQLLAIVAQVVLERLGYDGRGVLDKALERYMPGVEMAPSNKWRTGPKDYDRLAALEPMALMQTLVGALVFSESNQKDSHLTVTRYLAGARGTSDGGDSAGADGRVSDGDEEEEQPEAEYA